MDELKKDSHLSRPPLAYRNEEFLKHAEARPLRILSEYLEPLTHFRTHKVRDTIVFFGSARLSEDGPMGHYYQDARSLARMITEWGESIHGGANRLVITSGGGPGIMEAANRGASEAGGKTIGLNIGLPFEQFPNPYITPELNFEFHYFFMRKFWFAYLAKALIVFPGGFGTMDELFELLTLVQTRKLTKKIFIILYGSDYWNELINFKAFVKYGMIAESDLDLFKFADSPEAALELLKESLSVYLKPDEPPTPAIASTVKPER